MASLRTAFLQHTNFTTFAFESLIGMVRPSYCSCPNPDEKKVKKNQTKKESLEIQQKRVVS